MNFSNFEPTDIQLFFLLLVFLTWMVFVPSYLAVMLPDLRAKTPRWLLPIVNLLFPLLEPLTERVWEIVDQRMEQLAQQTENIEDDQLVDMIDARVRKHLGMEPDEPIYTPEEELTLF